jgi:hypothetical protein
LGLRPDGSPDVVGVARSVWQNPGQLPGLVRTAIDLQIARRALQSGRKQLGIGLGFPYYNSVAFDRSSPDSAASRHRAHPLHQQT